MKGYSVATLISLLADVKRWPEMRIKIDWHREMSGEEWRAWFRKCLHRKINRGLEMSSRKYNPEWFEGMRRAANLLNSRAVIRSHDLPISLRGRFRSRIWNMEDDI